MLRTFTPQNYLKNIYASRGPQLFKPLQLIFKFPILGYTNHSNRNHSTHNCTSFIMQPIAQSYNSSAANSSGRSSAMSISSDASTMSSISLTCPDSPTLPRLSPPSPVPSTRTFGSPMPKKIAFGTTKYIEPIRLCPIMVEDMDSKDEDQLILSPTNITTQAPTDLLIKVKQFENVHNARETKAKQRPNDANHTTPITTTTGSTVATNQPLDDFDAALALCALGTASILGSARRRPLYVMQQLEWLQQILSHSQPAPAPENDTISSDSSGWDYNNDSELEHLWPAPPMTPPEGDDMHPLQMSVYGTHPRQGWELNDPLSKNYYRFLIPNPSTKRLIVAPFISYNFGCHDALSISGTYGSGYPIQTYPLTPTPTVYVSPAITPEQLHLLDTKEPFADAVNHIINEYFPLNLSAAVRQYQYYRETEYAIQCTIRTLQDKEMRYIEKAIGVLSELENANVLGCLLAHSQEITDCLLKTCERDMLGPHNNPLTPFLTLATLFRGKITQSALDVRPNNFRQGKDLIRGMSSKERNLQQDDDDDNYYSEDDNTCNFIACKIKGMEDHLRNRLHAPKRTRAAIHVKPMHAYRRIPSKTVRVIKVCYECCKPGHIWAFCPQLSPMRK